ncbi:unnamed protein product [Ectocarpus sp. CCAP 1310/34]|nr:unnamed protein product [Ectocarpus sp. CCAP 1310/34]
MGRCSRGHLSSELFPFAWLSYGQTELNAYSGTVRQVTSPIPSFSHELKPPSTNNAFLQNATF